MNIKVFKKASAFALTLCFSLTAVIPAVATQVAANTITTTLTKDSGSGVAPVVQAKWEANTNRYLDDDLTTEGAQFNPTGVKDQNRTIAICAIVSDVDGDDINGVFADVFYPENIAVGIHHKKLDDQDGSDGAGCGLLMQEDELSTKLSVQGGWDLFCKSSGNSVYNKNNNLPTFGENYNYDNICAEDGTLLKEEARVYCTTKDLSYEDPNGSYEVSIMAQDKSGLNGYLTNSFTYLPLTAFETDFTSISYGNVKLGTHKKISGDLTFGSGGATVRNVGNTRLSMQVWQDDMDLGTASGEWNVKYDARVGSYADFVYYYPESTTTLPDILDLSETDEMDFSIEIFKFPTGTHPEDAYTGTMTLSAIPEAHLCCTGN